MRILIVTQYFTPEVTAARARLQLFAEELAARGHQVEVLCEVPNHPEGVVREGYRRRASVVREADGYRVRHVWVKTSPVKTTLTRMLFYGSFALSATIAGAFSRRPDVVLISSPPLPAALSAALIAKRHRVPWVMDVRDPWPEAAVVLGELSNPRIIRGLELLERYLYADAEAIVTVTESFRDGIVSNPAAPEDVTVISNGTTRAWLEAGRAEVDRAGLGVPEDRFVVTYAGNVGLAQDLDFAFEAAERLGDGFQLQIVGSGPRLEQAKDRAARLPDGRVVFRGLVEPEVAARYLRASDATLVPLNPSPEFDKFVPSKLFDCCAIGRPVLLAAKGESLRIAERFECALPVTPGSAAGFVDAVERLRNEPELAAALGEGGRRCAEEYLRERQVERLEEVLARAVVRRRA